MSEKAREYLMDHVTDVIAEHLIARSMHPRLYGPAMRAGWWTAVRAVANALADLYGSEFDAGEWMDNIADLSDGR